MPDLDPERKRARERQRRKDDPRVDARKRAWIKADPKRHADSQRRSRFKSRYGITADEFDAMAATQDGRCAICGVVPPVLVVDHNHVTNVVRGLLCRQCNIAIGLLYDSIPSLLAAIAYLRKGK